MSGNLFYDPRITDPIQKSLENNLMMLVSIKVPLQKSLETPNDPRINLPILKKSRNLFNDPPIKKCPLCLLILVSMCPCKKSLETYLMILVSKVPLQKISGNLFYDPRIKSAHTKNDPRFNKSAHTKKVWKLIL